MPLMGYRRRSVCTGTRWSAARRSGFSDRSAWVLRAVRPRLAGRYLAGMLAGVLLLIGVPYAEELRAVCEAVAHSEMTAAYRCLLARNAAIPRSSGTVMDAPD